MPPIRLLLLSAASVASPNLRAAEADHFLRYDRPASEWVEALPVGNGRLGAMVFGGVAEERLQLNEGTLWTGGPHDWNNPNARAVLPEVRAALFAGDYVRATELSRQMQGPNTQAYQPLADLRIRFSRDEAVSEYSRTLDLDRGVATVRYRVGDATFARELFCSFPDQVLVVRLTCDRPGKLNFTLTADSPLRYSIAGVGENGLRLRARASARFDSGWGRTENVAHYPAGPSAEGMAAELQVRVLNEGGRILAGGADLTVENADHVTILLSAATDFPAVASPGETRPGMSQAVQHALNAASLLGIRDLTARHEVDHQTLFRRVALDLGAASDAAELTTDARLARFYRGEADPGLATLLFHYGRYLMIAGSRPGGQALTLQGLWNGSLRPPWSSNYTLNINTQMNYWPAEAANLAECHEPLFGLIGRLAVTGQRTAEVNYGARGWVAHHNTDLWGHSAPVRGRPIWANWPMGGSWLVQHLWEHYAFGRDEVFLRERAWPLMRGAAEFCLDWLVDDGHGRLVTAPSTSPEIDFLTRDGRTADVAIGATMDLAIIRDLFRNCLEAADVLGIDDDFTGRLRAAQAGLLPFQIGARGQLQEWASDFIETDVHHRHTSHLFAVYPGREITPASPGLFAAAKKSLELRGADATGWALGWRINLWARFRDGDQAYVFVKNLLRPMPPHGAAPWGGGGVYPNLFDAHPPFQIDGNFAFTAGLCEMLVQSHLGFIDLLPALPSAWPSGTVQGLRARGGFEIAHLAWKNGRLERVEVRATVDGDCRLRYGDREIARRLKAGESFVYAPE
ncbi:MAG TPA: glycoside hydrolase family 95 protein [Opitutaceae bacterium]|nr:glycoside hydrolase family 95 protein [Opitutaceae bacterium]